MKRAGFWLCLPLLVAMGLLFRFYGWWHFAIGERILNVHDRFVDFCEDWHES